jgi:hypothetical protein
MTDLQSGLPPVAFFNRGLNLPAESAQTINEPWTKNSLASLTNDFITYRIEVGTASTGEHVGFNLGEYAISPQLTFSENSAQTAIAGVQKFYANDQNVLFSTSESTYFPLPAPSSCLGAAEKVVSQDPVTEIFATSQNIRTVAVSVFSNVRQLTERERRRLRKFYGQAYKPR